MRITVELDINEEQLDILIDINNGIYDTYDSWVNNAGKLSRAGLLRLDDDSETDPDDAGSRYRLTGLGFEALNQAAAVQVMN